MPSEKKPVEIQDRSALLQFSKDLWLLTKEFIILLEKKKLIIETEKELVTPSLNAYLKFIKEYKPSLKKIEKEYKCGQRQKTSRDGEFELYEKTRSRLKKEVEACYEQVINLKELVPNLISIPELNVKIQETGNRIKRLVAECEVEFTQLDEDFRTLVHSCLLEAEKIHFLSARIDFSFFSSYPEIPKPSRSAGEIKQEMAQQTRAYFTP